MSNFKKYRLNEKTLLFEAEVGSAKSRFWKGLLLNAASLLVAALYFHLSASAPGMDLPKTIYLEKKNEKWASRMEVMNRQMDIYDGIMEGLRIRDDEVYRNIFGMNVISSEIRNAGFGGVNRYAYLDLIGPNSLLKRTTLRLDVMTKKIYVQSKSFDDIFCITRNAGDMASCIPAISPLLTDKTKYRRSSPFGYRVDPINGRSRFHRGYDFACKLGNPVYATGDGRVERVQFDIFGYGNSIVIDHGFGYRTRYAHLSEVYVAEGMKLKRGECIGATGNSGRSTGPHLHYEVMYKGAHVNPYNYFDLTMPVEEYQAMVKKAALESRNGILRPHQRFRRR